MKTIFHSYNLRGSKRNEDDPLIFTGWYRSAAGNSTVPTTIWVEGECRDESCVCELEELEKPVLGLECDEDDVFHLKTIAGKHVEDIFKHSPSIVISDPICEDPNAEPGDPHATAGKEW